MSKIIKNAAEHGSKIIEPRKILSRVGDTPDHGADTDALLENARMEADLLLDDARREHQRIQGSIQTARREWERKGNASWKKLTMKAICWGTGRKTSWLQCLYRNHRRSEPDCRAQPRKLLLLH
ncbi:hypothetical protein ACPJHQ_11560 [Rossellomorea sp. H39__3]